MCRRLHNCRAERRSLASKSIQSFIVSGLALINFACVAETPNSNLVSMPTGNPEMRRELLIELDERDIWYRIVDDSLIEIKDQNTGPVAELFDGIIRDILPRGRSFSPDPQVLGQLTESLENHDITCKPVNAFDKDWLVCNSEDMKFVDETLTKIVAKSE